MKKRDKQINIRMNDGEIKMLDAIGTFFQLSRPGMIRYLIREKYLMRYPVEDPVEHDQKEKEAVLG